MRFDKGDIVVCVKLDDSGHLELNQRYQIYESIEMSEQHVIQIVKLEHYHSGKGLGFYSTDNFIPINEWRQKKINEILNNG